MGEFMKKFVAFPLECAIVAVLALLLATPRAMFAQDHVVSPSELQRQLAAASAARQHNRQQQERVFSTSQARQALKSAHVNYQQVNRAIGQLSDSELSMLAQRTAKAQKEFAAGSIAGATLLLILVAIAVLILIIVAVR
jgi:hypothetical protein